MSAQVADRAESRWNQAARLAESVFERLFHYENDRVSRAVRWLVLAGLLVFGLGVWGVFYSWGNLSLDFLDWAEVTGPRYALLKDAATRGVLPLHVNNTTALRGVTDRYFSIGDTPFSPQYLLLRFVDIGRYLMIDALLFYVLGFIGLALIQRKYRLSPFVMILMFLLFNFNGSITDQLAVGHSVWVVYFLTPYFVLLVMHLVERGSASWGWQLGLTSLMLVILLQGGFHLYLWCMIFLAFLGLYNPKLWKPIGLGGLCSILVALWRFLPPVLSISDLTNEYLGGFTTLTELFTSLIVLKDPEHVISVANKMFPLGYWELDFFVGLIGFGVIAFFGIFLPLVRDRSRQSMQVMVLLPAFSMVVLSIGQIYGILIKVLPLPPFTGERVTSRFLLLPLVFFLTLAMIFLQRELDRRKFQTWVRVAFLAGAFILLHDLMRHFEAWWIRYIGSLTNLFPKVAFDPTQHLIASRPDPLYISLLLGGSLVALLTLAFLAYSAFREKKAAAR